ncbi:response regulator [Arsenicibacter rosenii]|uniref:Response regulatory domain-containing protein n=1 Tax=Arsenicibacter rosenii TaxID=1750698 RepID=A0A1S2VKK2_9BACT|nr:response regulator [Arsenicibacter rosenii]OIN59291.1 hypothetical protein BLX24_09905 [Arsenicibacter rosenii]
MYKSVLSVAIVDDDADVRDALHWIIDDADGFSCQATYRSGQEALDGLQPDALPDVVLMDIGLPDQSDGLLHIITPAAKTFPQATYLGPIYQAANYGDLLRTWIMPEMMDVLAPVGLTDMRTGSNPARLDKVRWFARNALQGGNGLFMQRATNRRQTLTRPIRDRICRRPLKTIH